MAELCQYVIAEGIDIALLQEPYSYNGKVVGISSLGGQLVYLGGELHPRTCIYASSRTTQLGLIHSICYRDLVAIELNIKMADDKEMRVALISAYIPSETNFEPPSKELEEAVQLYRGKNIPIVVGCDANSHHEAWGSTDNNKKGNLLLDFIVSNNLDIINTGNTATFVTKTRQEVLDITLATSCFSKYVEDWKVDTEESFSDHRRITFQLECKMVKTQIRNARKTDWDKFDKNMKEWNPSTINQTLLAEKMEKDTQRLNTALTEAFHKACPLKEICKGKGQTWWNKELRKKRKLARRALRTALKNKEDPAGWNKYRSARNDMRNSCRHESKKGWQNFCEEINKTPQAARLMKTLAKDNTCKLGSIRNEDDLITEPKTVLDIMMKTHFPDCTEYHEEETDYNMNCIWDEVENIVHEESVTWSIMSFAPYKAPGPDGIFPKMLQNALKYVKEDLIHLYRESLRTGYIPVTWRKVKATFIPKPGKKNYQEAKSFRCISLSSYMMKALEKIIDRYIRMKISCSGDKLHVNQHAYMKGKSTDTALHNLIVKAERAVDNKEYAMGCFFDIEGAFDKATTDAIAGSLAREGIEPMMGKWIMNALGHRAISTELGGVSHTVRAKRGFPQGGCLSPLMWCLLLDDLIKTVNRTRVYMQAYSDDGVILVTGRELNMISRIMNDCLKAVLKWCRDRGLNLNPSKTKLIIFTKKRNNQLGVPVQIDNTDLEVVDEIRYLGVDIDSKLLFNTHIKNISNKAKIALMQCKRAIGKTWGLKPFIVNWIYKSIILPRLTYGAIVWWHRAAITCNKKALDQVQRLAGLMITSAIRTTPTAALQMILGLHPVDLQVMKVALEQWFRMKSFCQWKGNRFDKGHAKISSKIEENISMILANNDLIQKQEMFDKKYKIHIGPRNDWKVTTDNPILACYTDGSKKESTKLSGAGIYIQNPPSLHKVIPLGKFASVFQAEVLAILECASELTSREVDAEVVIYSDSQAALKALNKTSTTSALVRECKLALNKLSTKAKTTVAWVPGHQGNLGNEAADELARQGADETFIGPEPRLPIPGQSTKGVISIKIKNESNKRWKELQTCRQSKLFIKSMDPKRTRNFLQLSRKNTRLIIGLLTGHCDLNKHLYTMKLKDDPSCPECGQEESSFHYLAECPSYSLPRWEYLGNDKLEERDLTNISLKDVLHFCRATRRFEEVTLPEHQ
ncbi:hypothetical protein O0L34_g6668 [Tuta absoluta]|nr:hypothetical protein O0L34_g6668 [Tuta absoluta]